MEAPNDIISGDNGALEGNAIAGAPGIVGTAFSFDGTNGYVQIPDAPELDAANLTISAWVQFKSARFARFRRLASGRPVSGVQTE